MTVTKELLEGEGYSYVRMINGKWFGIHRMIFTTGLFCDLNTIGPGNGRICFHGYYDAVRFLESWDGKTAPTIADGLAADKRVKK